MISSFFGRNRAQLPLPPLDPPPSSEKRLEKKKAWLASVSKSSGKRNAPSPKYGSAVENVVKPSHSQPVSNGLLSPERRPGRHSRQSTGGSTKSSSASDSQVASTSTSRSGVGLLRFGSSSKIGKGKQPASRAQDSLSPISSNFVHIPLPSPSSHLLQAGPGFPFDPSHAAPAASSSDTSDDQTKTLSRRLGELESANQNGLLTDEEYRALKRNLFERTVNDQHDRPAMPTAEEWRAQKADPSADRTGQLLGLSRLKAPEKGGQIFDSPHGYLLTPI